MQMVPDSERFSNGTKIGLVHAYVPGPACCPSIYRDGAEVLYS